MKKKHGGLNQTKISNIPKKTYQQMDESWMTHGSFQKFFQKNIPKSQLFHESTAKDSEIRRWNLGGVDRSTQRANVHKGSWVNLW